MLEGEYRRSLPNANSFLLICVYSHLLSSQTNIAPDQGDTIYNEARGLSPNPEVNLAKQTHHIGAFTLIELLVTLCVLSILLMLVVPSFRTMILNSRLNSSSDTLVNALNYARSTALDQAINVQVCPFGTQNSTTCGTNWSNGWIVVTQPATGTATLLKSQQSTPNDPTLTTNIANVVFDPQGLSTTQSNFKLCDSRGGTFARSIEVLATGYIQSGDTPGQAVWNNSALTCP